MYVMGKSKSDVRTIKPAAKWYSLILAGSARTLQDFDTTRRHTSRLAYRSPKSDRVYHTLCVCIHAVCGSCRTHTRDAKNLAPGFLQDASFMCHTVRGRDWKDIAWLKTKYYNIIFTFPFDIIHQHLGVLFSYFSQLFEHNNGSFYPPYAIFKPCNIVIKSLYFYLRDGNSYGLKCIWD